MTRRRRHDSDEVDGDAPWRARDHGRAARPPEDSGDDHPALWSEPTGFPRPARGARGTPGVRDDEPGEATGPPWDLPGWYEAVPAQRHPRDAGAHPSGPLPGLPSGSGPPPISGPLGPVPREPLPAERSRYPAARHEGGYPGQDDSGYLRTGSGYGGADFDGGEYPAHGSPGYDDPGYDDPGYNFPASGRHDRGGYGLPDDPLGGDYGAPAGYDDEPDYPTGPGYPQERGYAGERDYPQERGYSGGGYPGTGYPAGPGYAEPGYPGAAEYPGHDGYADEPGYPGQDDGYEPADDYLAGHDQPRPGRYGRAPGDDPDDHGYGDRGGWYGDMDDDQAWGDEEYGEGLLPGLGEDEGDFRGARGRAPALERAPRDRRGRRPPPPRRPRGGKARRKGPMRRAAPWIALTVLVVVLAVAGSGFFYVWHNYLHPPDYSGPGTGSVTVQIKPGETATQVGEQLLAKGVVASVRAFANAAKASGHGNSLQPGDYRLHKHMAAALAFALLLKPSSRVLLKIVIIEGMRLSEIVAALGKATGNLKGYQQAIKDVSALGLPSYAKGNPEGYLFPATYTVQPGTQPIQVLRAMALRFNQEASSVNLAATAVHDQISEGDAITIASLVQAEGKRPQDLGKIARVIYNRLNARINLQLDTTVLYALHSRAADVTVAQTQNTRSRYNTYKHLGLPPGPIDSPGDAAIRAALHPARGDWLYFLTVNPRTGLTKFTNSFTVFQQYEQELANYNATHH